MAGAEAGGLGDGKQGVCGHLLPTWRSSLDATRRFRGAPRRRARLATRGRIARRRSTCRTRCAEGSHRSAPRLCPASRTRSGPVRNGGRAGSRSLLRPEERRREAVANPAVLGLAVEQVLVGALRRPRSEELVASFQPWVVAGTFVRSRSGRTCQPISAYADAAASTGAVGAGREPRARRRSARCATEEAPGDCVEAVARGRLLLGSRARQRVWTVSCPNRHRSRSSSSSRSAPRASLPHSPRKEKPPPERGASGALLDRDDDYANRSGATGAGSPVRAEVLISFAFRPARPPKPLAHRGTEAPVCRASLASTRGRGPSSRLSCASSRALRGARRRQRPTRACRSSASGAGTSARPRRRRTACGP